MLKLNADCGVLKAAPSATSRPSRPQEFMLLQKLGIGFPRGHHLFPFQETSIRRLIENFAKRRQHNINCLSQTRHPCSSVAKRLATNGVSFTPACLRPESTLAHSTTDSSNISTTITSRNPVTMASSRSLRISREASCVEVDDARLRACARKPMRGLELKIFCHAAVNVTETNHPSGSNVTGT